jgi:hypothetical protein
LGSAVVDLEDLPPDWRRARAAAGAAHIDDDELCGDKPRAQGIIEQAGAVFHGGPAGQEQLYSTVVRFGPGGAHQFLEQVRALASSCDQWSYSPNARASNQTATINRRQAEQRADEAYRVVIGDTDEISELDLLYLRHGDFLAVIGHHVQNMPWIDGDEEADPGFIDSVAKDIEPRLAALK